MIKASRRGAVLLSLGISTVLVCYFLFLVRLFGDPKSFRTVVRTTPVSALPSNVTFPIEISCNGRYIVAVISPSQNRLYRTAIRTSWATDGGLNEHQVIFFVGWNYRTNRTLLYERDKYGDVVFIDGHELKRELPAKMLSVMEWVNGSCLKARALIKADDDTFLHVPNLLATLGKLDLNRSAIFGQLIDNMTVERDPTARYYASVKDYAKPTFPRFIMGHAYIITMKAMAAILKVCVSEDYPMPPLADVFLNGRCAYLGQIERVNVDGFDKYNVALNPCNVADVVAIRGVRYYNMEVAWNMTSAGSLGCKRKRCLSETFELLCTELESDYSLSYMDYRMKRIQRDLSIQNILHNLYPRSEDYS